MAKEKEEPSVKDPISIARHAAGEGNIGLTNIALWSCDLPRYEKLEILAIAHERQAQVRDEMRKRATSEASDVYLVAPWQLEGIGLRAVAKHLRDLALSVRTRPSSKFQSK